MIGGKPRKPDDTTEVFSLRSQLEQAVAILRMQQPTAIDKISHRGDWFLITEDAIAINGQRYLFKDLFPYDISHGYDWIDQKPPIPTFSGDGKLLALTFGASFSYQLQPLLSSDLNYPRGRLVVFHSDATVPVFMSESNISVYNVPAISSNSRSIAFSYTHEWGPRKVFSDDGVQWNETLALLETEMWTAQPLITLADNGYGEWADPKHFYDLTFAANDTALLCVTSNERGVTETWSIPVDGSAPTINSNPYLDSPEDDRETSDYSTN